MCLSHVSYATTLMQTLCDQPAFGATFSNYPTHRLTPSPPRNSPSHGIHPPTTFTPRTSPLETVTPRHSYTKLHKRKLSDVIT